MPPKQKITIEKVVFGGAGLARVEGQVCFVNDVIRGEEVLVRVRQQKKGFQRAKLLEVLKPSPERVEPPCRYVKLCGGCQHQHMTYAEELRTKEEQVREAFERQLKISGTMIQPIRHGKAEYHYRNHVTLHSSGTRLGYIGRDNHSIVPVEECLIADPGLQSVFQAESSLRNVIASPEGAKQSQRSLRRSAPRDDGRRISFWVSEDGKVYSDKDEPVFFKVKILNRSITATTQGFFQNNLPVTELVIQQISKWVQESEAERFVDLYAGVGIFAVGATRRVARDEASVPGTDAIKEIVCAEENPHSVKALKENLAKETRKWEVLEGKVESVFPEWARSQDLSKNFIFLDPPRTGLDRRFCEFLASRRVVGSDPKTPGVRPHQIQMAYLSCDLAILIRDLKILTAQGGFQIKEAVPFDMFPKTKHIEVAVLLDGPVGDSPRKGRPPL